MSVRLPPLIIKAKYQSRNQKVVVEADKRELRVKKARQMATLKSDIIHFFCSQTIENDHTSRSVWLFIDIDL